MSATELVVELVKALAWPLAVVVLVLLLRPFISDRLTDFEAFGVRAQFRELTKEAERSAEQTADSVTANASEGPVSDIATVDGDLYAVAEQDPTRAIIEAYERVAERLRERLAETGINAQQSGSSVQVVRLAQERGLVDGSTADAIKSMTELRNLVVHGRKKVRSTEAVDYLTAADNVLYSLSRPSGRSTTRFTVTQDDTVIEQRLAATQAFRIIAGRVAREVGVEAVLAEIGPPLLGPTPDAVTRPQRAHRVAPDLPLWHTTQLNQSDYAEMAEQLSKLSSHEFAMVPEHEN